MKQAFSSVMAKQRLTAGLVGLVSLTLIGSLIWVIVSPSEGSTRIKTDARKTQIETGTNRVSPKEAWVERVEGELKAQKEQNVLLMKQMDQLGKSMQLLIAGQSQLPDSNDQMSSDGSQQDNQQSHSDQSTGQFTLPKFPVQGALENQNTIPQPPMGDLSMTGGYQSGSMGPNNLDSVKAVDIQKVTLKLSSSNRHSAGAKKTVENTIPAGAYAQAVLIGGVDASTSISAQSDPRPVLLTLTHPGSLPRRFKSDLKACRVLASSYGDLSSERVYMRLEKLTCTEPLTGEIVETQVAGYIAGEDGRAGVRGTVVDRSGEAVRNSLVGGFFSGLSQFLGSSQQNAVYPVSPFGQTKALTPQQMLGAGASQGVGNAMEKYAEFFIKRAEQLQPVIQIAAGRAVDIIFTQGTSIGDTSVKKALHKIREESRKEVVDDLQNTSDDKRWLPSFEGTPAP